MALTTTEGVAMAEAGAGDRAENRERTVRRAPAEPDPLWRKGYDTVERSVAPALSSFLRSDEFAQLVGAMTHLQHEARRQVARSTRRLLHLWNLPAATDVTRILNELGRLEQQVRELRQALDAKEVTPDARSSRPRKAGGTRPA